MDNIQIQQLKGTTTVGITCKDGVVLASDKRATLGTLIAHKFVKKTFKIDEHLGATVAGVVGDAQMLIKWMQAEARLYKFKRGRETNTNALASLVSNILFSSRYFPMIVQLVIGGYDAEPKVFSLDPLGSAIEDKYVATGSGSVYSYGILEAEYKENMNINDAIKLGIKAVKVALQRDAMSGDGIDVAVIDKEGFRMLEKAEVEKILKKI